MQLLLLSDISGMNGVKINTNDILIPKEYYSSMLSNYPETLRAVNNFFGEHKRAKAVVIKRFEGL